MCMVVGGDSTGSQCSVSGVRGVRRSCTGFLDVAWIR